MGFTSEAILLYPDRKRLQTAPEAGGEALPNGALV